jgi:hypothetical protein
MRTLLFYICTLNLCSLYAQENLAYTIVPVRPASIFVNSIDSLYGKILDSISHPDALIVQVDGEESYRMKIAFKTKKGYEVFDAFPEEANNIYSDRIDFNGKGNEELIIQWSNWQGTACYGGGFSENTNGYALWDLDKREMIFSYENYMWLHTWSEEYEFAEEDTADPNYEQVVVSEMITEEDTFAFDYPITISRKTIQVEVTGVSDEPRGETGDVPIPTTFVTYDCKKGRLIRRNYP